ncbi:MAG TPA: class I SAM-dependent methyltransferase [Gemmatimonadaceae bacterium]|nr:class I SAM-dependent methyltransferase [Gemmatimonadaceae bacterium]
MSGAHDLDKINDIIDKGWKKVAATTGYLSEREARFLMAAVALAPRDGKNLEIGSFKGRSTVGIAYVARELGLGSVVAVDPHTSPASTDPDLRGKNTSYDDFVANLRTAGVFERVEIKRAYSHDLAREWKQPIRFLWIDGDHTYKGAKADLDMFKPFLVDGAIVAMHDVLGTFEGALRVFVEEVLDSDLFGAAGFSGSIGWAQYRPNDGRSKRFRFRRKLLAIPGRKLIPVARRADHGLHGWNKFLYKFWRPLAPHGDVSVRQLARLITE